MPRNLVEINNLTSRKISVGQVKKTALLVLREEKSVGAILSIAFVGEKRMRSLNKAYRRRNKPTDVLAFSYSERSSIYPASYSERNARYVEGTARHSERSSIYPAGYAERPPGADPPTAEKAKARGEIIVCVSEIRSNAGRFKVPYRQEFVRAIIHGVLHLLGYEHEKSSRGAKQMFQKQEEYLKRAIQPN